MSANISWSRIEAALDELLLCARDQRESMLVKLTKDDAELELELRSLLTAHERAGSFLESPAISHSAPFLDDLNSADSSEIAGAIVGRYRLLKPIGRGGMGTVWLAERADGQFEHRVAVKLVKRGMDTDEVIARFRRERQILARLEHSNIARLIDGGVADDGRPFLVMEYFDGVPITTYCSLHRLTVNERLVVFEAVCQAVHHAHRNLIVHRDIKPSNVLVARDGGVKLLDFGIAKMLTPDNSSDSAQHTRPGWHRPLTMEYATPEQISGGAITTSTDVYQLGLLLYEMLSEKQAYEFESHTVANLERVICETDVRPPSSVAPQSRQRELRGDLDAIVLHALNKDPAQRYGSANAIADDLRSYRNSLAISLRGLPSSLRVQRFIRRYRRHLLAGTVVVALLAIGGITYTIRLRAERDRALLEAAKGGQSAEFVRRFFEGWNPGAADSSQVNVLQMLSEATHRTNAELSQQPELRAAMLSLLGGLYTEVNHFLQADSLLSDALQQQRANQSWSDADLAVTLARLGALYTQVGRYAQSDSVLNESLRMHQKLFGASHAETRRVQRMLAGLRGAEGNWTEVERMTRDLLTGRPNAKSEFSLFDTEVERELGYALFSQSRFDEAKRELETVLARQRALVGDMHASTFSTMIALGSTLRDMGELQQAEVMYRDALNVASALYGPDHNQTDIALFVLALNVHREHKLVETEQMSRTAIARRNGVVRVGDSMLWNWYRLLGMALLDEDRLPEAVAPLQTALEGIRQLHPNGNEEEPDLTNRLAYIAQRIGNERDAAARYADAIRVRDRRPAGSPDNLTDGIHFLAWTMRARGDTAAAHHVYDKALHLYTKYLPADHPDIAFARAGMHDRLSK